MDRKGITIVSPMYGDLLTTNRMVFSVVSQYISETNPFNIHLVLVDDYIEGRLPDNHSIYEYYLSPEFKQLYSNEHIEITLIKNKTHLYQGLSREVGFMRGRYRYFLLLDCDDMLAPNACDRFITIIEQHEKDHPGKGLACIYGLVYGFDTDGYEQKINGESIWVQSRCYNRKFIVKHDIHFPTDLNSKYGEDYPFIKKFDYALANDKDYQGVKIPYNENEDCQCTAYWFPNHNSLSRKDKHYAQHLSGWTMAGANSVLDYYEEFNKKNDIENEEYMKSEHLNMAIYSFYNLLDFLKEVSTTDYKPLEEDWYMLRDNVRLLRQRLKDKYYSQLKQSEIEDMLYNIRHFTDCRVTESWIGNFYDYMNNYQWILYMSYECMLKYCKEL